LGLTTAVFAEDDEPPVREWERRDPDLNQAAEILDMKVPDV